MKETRMIRTLVTRITLGAALLAANAVVAQDHSATATAGNDAMASCPMHAQHMAEAAAKDRVAADGSAGHGQEVDSRHDTFGMPHNGSTHSFRLFAHGGVIEPRANSAADEN